MKRSAPLTRRTPLKRSAPRFPKRGFTPASPEQRAKVRREGPRIGERHDGEPVDAAHIVPRGMGGCDHEDCVIGLPRTLHREYDQRGTLDILPFLTLAEQGHAASHLGLLRALKKLTNEDWVPVPREAA